MTEATTTRRRLIGTAIAGGLGAGAAARGIAQAAPAGAQGDGAIRQSVARWTFEELSLPELCDLAGRLGLGAIDLVGPDGWPELKEAGIDSSMCNGAEPNLTDGFSDPSFHADLVESYARHIDLVADAGYTNLILFSGNARGMDPETGLRHAAEGIGQILGRAEERGVVLHMELLNSRVDHPDYMADNTPWGVDLCERLGSDNFRLLYDIYHMQIMEGDVIRRIRDHSDCIGHYHTAGVPGRHEIGAGQELQYPAIVSAIAEAGFDGYLAHEFIPTSDTPEGAEAALGEAVRICTV